MPRKIYNLLPAFALAAFFHTPARAEDIVAMPSCSNEKGETVVFAPLPHEIFMKSHSYFAHPARDANTNIPTVFYDPVTLATVPQTLQSLILRHECAHHSNGDVDQPQMPEHSEFIRREKAADCTAVRRLRDEEHYGPADMQTLIQAFTDDQLKFHNSPEATEERAMRLYSCYVTPSSA